MWAATYDDRGGGTHHSHSHLQHPLKLWTETVNRLWRLRRQYWQRTSLLSPHHHHRYPPHPSQHHPHQHKRSHQRYPHHQHTNPDPQHLYHPQSSPQHALAHPQSSGHYDSHPADLHRLQHHDDNQHLQGRARLQGHQQPPLCPADSRLPHCFVVDNDKSRICSMVPYEASKVDGLQGPNCAKPIQSAATLVHQDCKNQGLVQNKKAASGYIKEALPMPSGLVKRSDSKALCHMVNKHVETYIHELKQPSSIAACKDYNLLKPSPIIHAGSLYHFKPPNLGQRDFEEWMRKHRRKKVPKSGCSSNIAFGRSISSQRRRSATSATKTEAKNDTSFIKCMRGKLNARREVLKAIQDYHINAEARAQLEKRASEFEQEKKERQRKKAASQKQAAMERRSHRTSLVNTLLK